MKRRLVLAVITMLLSTSIEIFAQRVPQNLRPMLPFQKRPQILPFGLLTGENQELCSLVPKRKPLITTCTNPVPLERT